MKLTAKPKSAPAPDAATAAYRAEKAKRAAAAPADADAMRAKLAELRAQEKALRAQAQKAGLSLKRERTLPETPANGALLSMRVEAREGVGNVLTVEYALGDGSLQTRDGRIYALNVTAPVSVPVEIEGLDGAWATGGQYVVERQPEPAAK